MSSERLRARRHVAPIGLLAVPLRVGRFARRAARKPPRELIRRAAEAGHSRLERRIAPGRGARFGTEALLTATGAMDVDALWSLLAEQPFASRCSPVDSPSLERVAPRETARVETAAAKALAREVDLLGSGPTRLGRPIDWHTDFKTGHSWPLTPSRGIDYANLDRPSDVKVPWELSRLQWLIPVGQAYLLTGEAHYAEAARAVLEEWIEANPYGLGVSWAVAMEPSLRILTWTWLFHVFAWSEAWSDIGFRGRFLTRLWLHGDWTLRNLERSDVNGNHYTANGAGLVFAGLFFGAADEARRWAERGWRILTEELPRQVHADGVDFEGSVAYHRLVAELFLLPALYREALGLSVPDEYRRSLAAMARFSLAATRADGTTPLVGDHDDARALPLGNQPLSDHRYLAGVMAAAWEDNDLRDAFAGPRSEIAWLLGPGAAATLPERGDAPSSSAAFTSAGFYVMRDERNHVFVDCGPVGLAGRGGHGHNDCLSFEAWLDSVHLVSDSGCDVYTASPEWRNRLRETAAHNTPLVDDAEQNRLDPEQLWSLGNDATPHVRRWEVANDVVLLEGAHDGYRRLADPVTPVRTIALDLGRSLLAIHDSFEGGGAHLVRVPLHLALGVDAAEEEPGRWLLTSGSRSFVLLFEDATGWTAERREAWVAPSYGVRHASACVELRREGPLAPLLVVLAPVEVADDALRRGRAIVRTGR